MEPWLAKWRIKVNAKKTQFVIFGSRRIAASLKLCGEEVKEAKQLKFLGTTFDRGNTKKPHIKEIASRAMSRVSLLKRLRGQTWGASRQRLLIFYKQFVRPVMENGYSYTAMAKSTSVRPLRVVQNSAMRTILRAPPRTLILDMENKTGLQDVHKRLSKLKTSAEGRYKGSPLIDILNINKELLKV